MTASGSSPSCATISDTSTWSRRPCNPRQPVRPEVVTYVLGTLCHPCVRTYAPPDSLNRVTPGQEWVLRQISAIAAIRPRLLALAQRIGRIDFKTSAQ
jgi:hypothetical protein